MYYIAEIRQSICKKFDLSKLHILYHLWRIDHPLESVISDWGNRTLPASMI